MTSRLALVHSSRPQHEPAQAARRQRILGAVAVAALVLVALFGLIWRSFSEQTAIHKLPREERQALLERTLENLATVCGAPTDGLRDWCRGQAELVLEIPECNSGCKALAALQLSRVQLPR
jgi:type II secretory pathway component PulM